ncbi:DUF4262 domain-containing protein [Sphingomonas sp.]|uniref:DUF4262 domain-containing protein n=1 Tax=Sphingomonas sp. TaxID=28214 RepID=UPI00286CAA6C|nr:DUF4262 domain-containing protein [Sphingomonas sp.]
MRISDSEFEAKIIANVDQHGCSINVVSDPDGDDPAFAYSIGFPTSVSQPEVIVFGLSSDLMQSMINETQRQCSEDALTLQDGAVIAGLLEGFNCVLRAVPEDAIDAEHFNSAIWYRRVIMGEKMDRAFQIFWPGASDGLFPWDEAADPHVVRLQSELLKDIGT